MWHYVRLAVGTGLVMYVILCIYLWAVQGRYMYYPGAAPSLNPAYLKLPFEELRLTTSDGATLHGWYVPANNATGGWTLIHCHGNAGSVENRLDALKTLHDKGISSVVFDYRGYGASTGTPTEQGTYEDAMAVWTYLTQVRGIPTNRIVVFGESMGGAVAVELARRVHPGALVVESSFTSSPDMAAGMFPFLPARLLCRFQYNSLAKIGQITCPVLIAHGRRDETIPYGHGQRLFAAAPEPKRFVDLAGGHNDGGLLMGELALQDELVNFLATSTKSP